MQMAADPPPVAAFRKHLGKGAEDPPSRCAERVPDSDCATAGVDDVRIDSPGVDACQGLHRERFVELDGADLAPARSRRARAQSRQPRPVRSRNLRLERCRAASRDSGNRVSADDLAALSEPSSSADAPSLSGEALPAVMVPSGRKEGFRAVERLRRGVGADALVARELDVRERSQTGRRRSRQSKQGAASWWDR